MSEDYEPSPLARARAEGTSGPSMKQLAEAQIRAIERRHGVTVEFRSHVWVVGWLDKRPFIRHWRRRVLR